MFTPLLAYLDWLIGTPLIAYTVGISILCTFAFKFVQFRSFFDAWRIIIFPAKSTSKSSGDMTPLQAFINTLSTNLGNGSVGGASVAVYTGGPGAGVWVLIIGILLMAVRFTEVYASTLYGAKAPKGTVLGGPMLYLEDVIGGKYLSWMYAFLCLAFALMVGNTMQTNTMGLSLHTTWGVSPLLAASVLTLFITYVVMGGSERIIAVSDYLVPIKVLVFFSTTIIIIGYHGHVLGDALALMWQSAFSSTALIGGVAGFSVMHAIKAGMNLSITATESGLGTAAILFGFTGNNDPVRSGLMGMISTFVSSLVCFIVALCVVVSGVWDSGLTSTALTIAAFNTVFGQYGGWIITFLSLTFGTGVLVAYAYIARASLLSLTNGRFAFLFPIMYCVAAFVGPMSDVKAIWQTVAIMNGAMIAINLFGLVYLLPKLMRSAK